MPPDARARPLNQVRVQPGSTVAVVGDGVVGLLGVLATKQLGAQRIIAMSRHESRQKLAHEFGATTSRTSPTASVRRPSSNASAPPSP